MGRGSWRAPGPQGKQQVGMLRKLLRCPWANEFCPAPWNLGPLLIKTSEPGGICFVVSLVIVFLNWCVSRLKLTALSTLQAKKRWNQGLNPSCPMGKAKDVTIIFLPLFVSARKHVGLASKSKWSDKTKVGAVSPPLSERASTTPFPFDVAEERGIQSKYLPLFAGLQRENSWFSPFLSFRLFDRLSLHV